METTPFQKPEFGDNPGNFRKLNSVTLGDVFFCVARSLFRGAFREGLHAGVAGLCNLNNQWFCRHREPRFHCSCCGQSSYAFLHLSNRLRIAWHSACPICDSRSRHRGLALLIPQILGGAAVPQRVLHFAPENVLRKVFVKLPNVEYRTTDLFVKGVDYPGENIEALSFRDGVFDIISCNHVLEHVADDEAAMAELARILSPAGVVVITIPGDWSLRDTIKFVNTDLNGHYRDYGMDVKDRFQRHFAGVELFDMHQLDPAPNGLSHGIRPNDLAFICRQPRRFDATRDSDDGKFMPPSRDVPARKVL